MDKSGKGEYRAVRPFHVGSPLDSLGHLLRIHLVDLQRQESIPEECEEVEGEDDSLDWLAGAEVPWENIDASARSIGDNALEVALETLSSSNLVHGPRRREGLRCKGRRQMRYRLV